MGVRAGHATQLVYLAKTTELTGTSSNSALQPGPGRKGAGRGGAVTGGQGPTGRVRRKWEQARGVIDELCHRARVLQHARDLPATSAQDTRCLCAMRCSTHDDPGRAWAGHIGAGRQEFSFGGAKS